MAYNFNFLFYCVFHLGIAEKVMTSLTSQNISFHFTNQGLFTRSKTVPYDSNLCFFCEEKAKYQNPLHLVSTSSASSSLDNAIKQSKDSKLLVKLSTALDSTDAHSILRHKKWSGTAGLSDVPTKDRHQNCQSPQMVPL